MKIVSARDGIIEFDDYSYLVSDHTQDCCEHHYLAFGMLNDYNINPKTGESINIKDVEFDFSNGVPFERVEGTGILLRDVTGAGYLVNGYGYNNGWYGTDIELSYCDANDNILYSYDVSECQEIQEY